MKSVKLLDIRMISKSRTRFFEVSDPSEILDTLATETLTDTNATSLEDYLKQLSAGVFADIENYRPPRERRGTRSHGFRIRRFTDNAITKDIIGDPSISGDHAIKLPFSQGLSLICGLDWTSGPIL